MQDGPTATTSSRKSMCTHAPVRHRHNKVGQEIPLWEMLEEEYEHIHGKAPANYENEKMQKLQEIKAKADTERWDRARRSEAENEKCPLGLAQYAERSVESDEMPLVRRYTRKGK